MLNMLSTLAHAIRSGHIKAVRSKRGDAVKTLVSVFQRTIVSAVVVLTLSAAVANAQTSVWLEAECASVGSLWNRPTDANASGSSYVVIQPGNNSASSAPTNSAGYVNFSFSVGQSGTYRVFSRVLCPPGGNDDSWWVRMDGGSWVMWNGISASSWTWAQFPNTFNLSAGSHTLTFAYREDGAQLDKINITTSTTAPTGTGSTASNLCSGGSSSVWLEAECGSLGSLWNTPSDNNASQGRYLVIQSGNNSTGSAPTNSAGYANYSFSVGQSGTYSVFARVLCPPGGNDDSWWVRMDGGSWTMWNGISASSWTWAQFPNTFNLSAGSHTLTFAYREDGAQLDKINITTSTTAPTGAGSAASNLCSPGPTPTPTPTPTLSVSPATVNVAAAANSSGTFNITSNTSWTVTDNQSWLTVGPASGSNNGTVTVTAEGNTSASARTATVTVAATGVPTRMVTVTQSGSSGGGECPAPQIPTFASLPTNSFLPDPFTFLNGSRATTAAEWACRRAEIAALAQEFEYGYKPNTPYSATTGAFSGNTLTVNVNDNGRTISFNVSISYPSSGSAPYPAIIGVGGSNLNNSALSSMGVAVINFNNNEIAQQNGQSSRGVGKFYDMYGSGHSAGALMAWAWGVSRLIDAIEKIPGTNIDPARIGVTGCSRNGKGALAVGAFDERIKLTIPQESGSGGSGSWRVSNWMLSQGQETQTLSQIVGENVWFRANFNQFGSQVNKLPFDHHSIIGLVAPRAILIIENDILWLGPQSSWSSANAARLIWQAFGVPDMMGYSLTTGHTHCSFPSSQQSEVNAYVQRFLIGGGSGNTNVMRNDPGVTFNQSMWINWSPEIF